MILNESFFEEKYFLQRKNTVTKESEDGVFFKNLCRQLEILSAFYYVLLYEKSFFKKWTVVLKVMKTVFYTTGVWAAWRRSWRAAVCSEPRGGRVPTSRAPCRIGTWTLLGGRWPRGCGEPLGGLFFNILKCTGCLTWDKIMNLEVTDASRQNKRTPWDQLCGHKAKCAESEKPFLH